MGEALLRFGRMKHTHLREALRTLLGGIALSALFFGSSGAALADGDGAKSVPFSSSGSGVYTGGGPAGCQFGGQCTDTAKGTITVNAGAYTFPATFTSVSVVDYSKEQQVSPGNYCAPTTVQVTITSTLHTNDQISKSETGTVCASDSAGAAHTFTGTYQITGGAGRFQAATGTGSTTSQDNGGTQITSTSEKGTISYKGAKKDHDGDPGDNGQND